MMNNQGTNTAALVQKVRTFADDMRRAKERVGATQTPAARHPAEQPVAATTAPLPQTPPAPRLEPHRIASHLADEDEPLDIRKEAGDTPQEGVIVKDTRYKRWTLRKAIGKSVNAWVDEQKQTVSKLTDTKTPQPNVPPPQTRAVVIEAARQKSALAPKDDRHLVVEKLRTLARDAARVTGKPYSLTPHSATEQPPRWSSADGGVPPIKQARPVIRPPQAPLPIRPGTTPGRPVKLLEKDVAPAAAGPLPETTFVSTPKREVAPAPVLRSTEPVPYGFADVAATADRASATHTPAEMEQPVSEQQRPAATSVEDAAARSEAIKRLLAARKPHVEPPPPIKQLGTAPSRDIPFTPPTFDAQKTTNYRTYRDDAIQDVEKHKRSVPRIAAAEAVRRAAQTPRGMPSAPASTTRPFVTAGITMVVMIALGGFGLFWYARNNAGDDVATVRIPAFMSVDSKKSVPFSTNRAELLSTLDAEVRSAGNGITQMYPAYTDRQTGSAIGSAVATTDFMYVLDPRAPGSFIRNLADEMMLGASGGTDPFLVFKTKQFDTAFAGMLDWEPYMSADLTPLFGAPVTRTQDLTVRTVDQTRAAQFVDDTLQNVDVRILYDETGAERILYAFPDADTVVITTSSSALTALLERLQ